MKPSRPERAKSVSEWGMVLMLAMLLVMSIMFAKTAAAASTKRCFGEKHNGEPMNNQANFAIGRLGNDVLTMKGGDDTALGLSGNDRLCGGRGSDTLDGGDGFDRLRGGPGYDICRDGERVFGCECTSDVC